jgi:hypothetical protein
LERRTFESDPGPRWVVQPTAWRRVRVLHSPENQGARPSGWLSIFKSMFERDVDNPAADPAAGDRVSAYRLDEIAAAERLIRIEQAKQVDAVVSYVRRQRMLHGESDLVERGSALEVAAALRCSQGSAQRFIADAEALVADHPEVLNTLESGRINLWVARQVVAATGCLRPELRRLIDGDLASEAATLLPGQVREMADRRVAAADPDAAAKRARRARAEKNVFHAKRPDTMGLLGANLPAEQAVACFEALDHDARAKRADGDHRSIDHIMCDTLVERLTGARRATEHLDKGAAELPHGVAARRTATRPSTSRARPTPPDLRRPSSSRRYVIGSDSITRRRLVGCPADQPAD